MLRVMVVGLALMLRMWAMAPAEGPRATAVQPPAVKARSTVDPRIAAIKPALGLADIGIEGPVTGISQVTLVVRSAKNGPEAAALPERRIPLAASGPETARSFAPARVMTGSPQIEFFLEYTQDGQQKKTDTFTRQLEVDPGLDPPVWAMGAVWYQIFPERFRNGNPKNDPRSPDVFLMDWTADWYAVNPKEEAAWRARTHRAPDAKLPDRKGGPIYNWIWDRRYGGDLQGVVEKLDELKGLGVTAIYLNPIFEAFSLHKYDASDHRHIDSNLAWPVDAGEPAAEWSPIPGETEDQATWTWTPADRYFIDVFLPECHKRGLRVILDGVWNHCGRRHFAFQDIVRQGDKSPYKDWFYCDFDESGKLKGWKAWDGPNGTLPKFRQTPEGDLVAPVKTYIFNVTRRWMDPNGNGDPSDGIDGWRLDVVPDVGKPFWRSWRTLVKSINPDAVTIAEIWFPAHDYLKGDMFDTQMHYPFAIAVTDWLGCKPGMKSEDFAKAMEAAFTDAPQTNLIHQNLIASHDTDRFVSMLNNPGREYGRNNNPQNGDKYKEGKPPKEIYGLSMLGVALQATYLGAPMIYYGDEYGMWGANDPTDRKPIPWPDKGANQNPDDAVMPELRAKYAEWFGLRQDPKTGPILRYGDVRILPSGSPDVLVFVRSLNGDQVIVAVNRGSAAFDLASVQDPAVSQQPFNGPSQVPPVTARWWYVPAPNPGS